MDERYDYLTELAGQGQVPINDAFFEMLGVQEGVEAQRAVGPYTPTEKIGQGAAGDVWLAQDPEGNLVAIKILRDRDSVPAPVADVRRARFLREAETLQGLDHPNIVRVYSIQEHNDCLSFVMEYVDGSNLKNELTVSGTISPERTLEILDQVLDAVEYAHKKGIIHRDIKPANILLTSDGKVKLCDFGIAHIKNEETMLTQDGTIVGSYGYLSPEQAYCYRVRKQSDLFSVAVVAYEMVTGTNPFWKDTQQEMLKAIRNPQVSEFKPEQVEGLPRGFAPTVMRALSRYWEDRPPSAAVFRRMIHTDIPASFLYPSNVISFGSARIRPPRLEWIPSRQTFVLASPDALPDLFEAAAHTGHARDVREEAVRLKASLEELNGIVSKNTDEQVAYHDYLVMSQELKRRIANYLMTATGQIERQLQRLLDTLEDRHGDTHEQADLTGHTDSMDSPFGSNSLQSIASKRRVTLRAHDSSPRTAIQLMGAYIQLIDILVEEGFGVDFLCAYLYLLADLDHASSAEQVAEGLIDLTDRIGDPLTIADAEMAIAYLLIKDGSTNAAQGHIEEALAIYEDLEEKQPLTYLADVAFATGQLAWCLWRNGRRTYSVLRAYRRALDAYRPLSATNHKAHAPEVARLKHELALLVSKSGTDDMSDAVLDLLRDSTNAYSTCLIDEVETYGPALIRATYDLADHTDDEGERMDLHQRVQAVAKFLDRACPVEFDPILADALMFSAQFQEERENLQAALESYEDAASTLERLSLEAHSAYASRYATTLERIAMIQDTLGFIEAAEETRIQAQEALIR